MHCYLWLAQFPYSAWYFSLEVSHLNRNLPHFCFILSPRYRLVHLVYSAQPYLNVRRSQPLSLIFVGLSGWHFLLSPSTSHLPFRETLHLHLRLSHFSFSGIQ